MTNTVIFDRETWDECVQAVNSADIIAFDYETTKTDNWSQREPMGLSVAVGEGKLIHAWYLPFNHKHHVPTFPESNMPSEWLKDLDFSRGIWVAHNVGFDMWQNKVMGLDLPAQFRCTQVEAHLANENRFSYKLADLAHDILRAEKLNLSALEKLLGWDHIPPSAMGNYANVDTELCYRLDRHFYPILESEGLLDVLAETLQFSLTLMDVSAAGLPLDVDRCDQLSEAAGEALKAIEARLGWSPAKRGETAHILHAAPVEGGLGLPVLKRSPKPPYGPVLDRATLTRLQVQYTAQPEIVNILQDVMDYRTLQKAQSTWYEGFQNFLDDDGLIHPGFKIHGTKTGRISSERPNTQQLPRL